VSWSDALERTLREIGKGVKGELESIQILSGAMTGKRKKCILILRFSNPKFK
jgi:hypothetical protein